MQLYKLTTTINLKDGTQVSSTTPEEMTRVSIADVVSYYLSADSVDVGLARSFIFIVNAVDEANR